ncbi:MAG: S8 family peptidase [Fimbriimonadales bacterium]
MKLIALFVSLLVGGFIIGAFAFGSPTVGGGSDAQVDPEVAAIMEKEPDKQHDLILSIRLNRAPLDLERSIASNDERNECTQAFCDWEDLIEKQKSGDGSVTDNDIVAAYDHAMWLDSFVLEKDTIARSAYHEDYSALSRESCQPVYESLKAMFGENVTWPTENLNMFAIKATRDDLVRAISVEGIKRVSREMRMASFLNESRKSIRADKVNSGYQGVGPYTGAGVMVAVVDDGYDNSHPRLPAADPSNQYDTSNSGGAANQCTHGHGTNVAGVIFCEPDAGDGYAGIAYDATPLIAKTAAHTEAGWGCTPNPDWAESWAESVESFNWAAVTKDAPIINFSRGSVIYFEEGGENTFDTMASHHSAMEIDWYVYSADVCFVHSCGNVGTSQFVSPPSGSYNCISVGAYEDNNSESRSDDTVWSETSPGPTDDGRKKPDLCAPGFEIMTTRHTIANGGFVSKDGTSFAAPHVAGVCALLKEARPSLLAPDIKAILINSTQPFAGVGGATWHSQAGWGALDAYTAVATRNYIKNGGIPRDVTHSYSFSSAAGQDVSVTLVWQRKMAGIDEGVAGSPRDLNLYLDRNVGGTWVQVAASESGDIPNFEGVFDNVERVFIAGASAPAATYRVRVVRPFDGFLQYTEDYSLACRRPFLNNP